MGETLPSTYIFGVLGFILIIMGGMGIMSIIDDDDTSFASDDPKFEKFNTSFNKYSEVNEKITELQTNIKSEEGSGNYEDFGVLSSLILKSWISISLLGDSFSFMNDVFNSVGTIFGVPGWIPAIFILFIGLVIVVGLLSAVFQRRW